MIWKEIPGWPYIVSDTGEVRNITNDKTLTPMWTGRRGKQYATVRLSRNRDYVDKKVHILVLEAFVGPRPHGAIACHRDDDTRNNSAGNLYWGSHRDNAIDRRDRVSKITKAIADNIRARRHAGEKGRTLAAEFGISEQLVCDIIKGRKWN